MINLLKNPGFELDWGIDESHRVLIFYPDGGVEDTTRGNIFTPSGGWLTWFYHDPGTFDQPEVRDVWKQNDPRRVRSGEKAILLFSFGRRHMGGFLQQVSVEPGTCLRLTAHAHAWSNHKDKSGDFPHPDDGEWSEGAGYEVVCWTPDEIPPLNGDAQNDAKGNFAFCVGIDSHGGTDPLADSVVWGEPRYCYNGYTEPITVETVAQSSQITVFLRSTTLWEFKHNDAYFDDVELVALEEPPGGRGQPRTQYHRTYVLMPPASTEDDWHAAVSRHFADRRTIGGSADDGGIGDLDERRVVAVAPGSWPGGEAGLRAFYTSYYPGVVFEVEGNPPPSPPPPPPPPPPVLTEQLISLHLQKRVQHDIEFITAVQPSVVKTVLNMEFLRVFKAVSPNILTIYRQYLDDQGIYWSDTNPNRGARRFLETFLASLEANADVVDFVESLNETIATDDFDGIQRTVAFDIALCEELKKAMGDAVRPAILTAAVGNPQHGAQTKMLIPAAEACVAHKGILGYHGYSYYPGYDHFGSDWRHHAGRGLESWDVEFRAAGVYPSYVFTECGVCATAHAGWKHRDCMDGHLNEYILYLLELKRKLNEWNALHGHRCLGATLFTSGGGSKWENFNLAGDDLRRLAEALVA